MADHSHQAGTEQQGKPLPQLNPDGFASQLFWLALVFAALYVVMARSIIPRIREVLTKRSSQIQHDLDSAEKAKAEAEGARSSYEADLAGAKQKASDLLQQAQRDIDAHMASEQAALKVTLDAIITDAESRIEGHRAEAMEQIRPVAQSLTIDICKRFLAKAPTKAAATKALKSVEGA